MINLQVDGQCPQCFVWILPGDMVVFEVGPDREPRPVHIGCALKHPHSLPGEVIERIVREYGHK